MARRQIERLGIRQLDDPSQIHHRNPIRDVFDHRQIVGDEDDGEVHLPLQAEQQVDDLGLHRDIEGRDRLVAHQQLGLEGDGAGDADPLALTAGKLVGVAIHRAARQAHFCQQFLHPAAPLLSVAFTVDDKGLLQDLAHGVAAVEGFCRVLKHHLHLLTQGAHLLRAEGGDVAPLEGDGACGRLEQLEQAASEGGLAAARLTHQPQRLPLFQVEADAIHRVNRILLAQEPASQPEVLFQIPDR